MQIALCVFSNGDDFKLREYDHSCCGNATFIGNSDAYAVSIIACVSYGVYVKMHESDDSHFRNAIFVGHLGFQKLTISACLFLYVKIFKFVHSFFGNMNFVCNSDAQGLGLSAYFLLWC